PASHSTIPSQWASHEIANDKPASVSGHYPASAYVGRRGPLQLDNHTPRIGAAVHGFDQPDVAQTHLAGRAMRAIGARSFGEAVELRGELRHRVAGTNRPAVDREVVVVVGRCRLHLGRGSRAEVVLARDVGAVAV